MKVLHKIFLACLLFLLIVPVVQAEGTGGYSDLYGLTCRNNNENIYGAWTFIGATEFVGDVTFNKMTGDTIIVTILDVQKLDVDSIYMVDATGDDSTSWHDDGTYSTLHFDNPLKLTGASVLHGNSAASWSIYDSDLETGVSIDTAGIVIGGSDAPQINGYATDGSSSSINWIIGDKMQFLNAGMYQFDNLVQLGSTETPFQNISCYDISPVLAMTDTDINKNISSGAQATDSCAIVLNAAQTTPTVSIRNSIGDRWDMTIQASGDSASFEGATGGYLFDDGLIIGDAITDVTTLFGTITSDQVYATPQTVFYLRSSTTGTSGEHNNLRARAQSTAESASTSDIRGVYGQGIANASKYAGAVTGVFANAIAKNASVSTHIRGTFIEAESEATPTSIGELYGAYIRTKVHVAPTTYYGLMIDNELMATGFPSDAYIGMKSTSWGAAVNSAAYGIDMNGITALSTGDLRLHNGALFYNSTADLLTITEATVTVDGALNVTGAFTPGSILLVDDADMAYGTDSDVLYKWSTNGAGDDLFVSRFDKADANASVAWFMSQDLDPSGMTDHADYLSPTLIMVNDEGADANDYAAVVIGERTNANVAATHYYDFYAMTGAVDGTPDPNITETGAIFRFGSSGSITAVTATGAGDVLFENDIEVVGTMTLGHDAANTSGIIYFVASDNDLGNVAITTDDYLVFTDFTLVDVNGDFTAGTVASITAGNLVDKSATEAISGRWTFNDGTTFDDSLIIANIAAVVDFDSVLTLYTGADSPSDAFVEVVNSANYGRLSIGRTSGSESSILSIVDGGGDNKPGLLSLYDDGGGGNYLWISTANELYGHTSAPSDDDADGFPIMDFDTGAMGESGVAFGGLTITAAGNTFNLTQGTSSLDVASGKAVNIDQNLSITTEAITLDQSLATSDDVQFGAMTATGILSGMSNITLDTDPTIVLGAADCKNMVRINNDADVIDYTLPAAEAGLVVVFLDVAGAVITVDPFDGADTIYLNGASVGAGDAIDSPGAINDKIVLIALDATRWWVLSQEGAWVDGGAD